jgi:hypothetical protein
VPPLPVIPPDRPNLFRHRWQRLRAAIQKRRTRSAGGDVHDVPHTALHALAWTRVFRHAWLRIKASWREALVGGVVALLLPAVLQWWRRYDLSESGFDKVTDSGWVWSVVALGAWLTLVAVWHFICAPIRHAREVLTAWEQHRTAEIKRVREEAKAEGKPSTVNIFPADEADRARLLSQMGLVEPRPTGPGQVENAERPARRQERQAAVGEADDGPDGADHDEPAP